VFDSVLGLFRTEDQKLARKLLALSFSDDGAVEPSLTGMLIKLVKEIEISIDSGPASGTAKVTLDHTPVVGGGQQLAVLSLVDQVAKALPRLLRKSYFVLIDDLDLHWTNDPVENALIAALFSSMARMRSTTTVKFVVALRDDIYKCLPIEDKDKSRDWLCDVFWDRESIRRIVEARMKTLHNVGPKELWEALLPDTAFDVMIEHARMKPREMIRQIQLLFDTALRHGHSSVTTSDLIEGLRRFSLERLEELEQEQAHRYPNLGLVVKQFVGRPCECSMEDLRDLAQTAALSVLDQVDHDGHWAVQCADKPRDFAVKLVDAGFLLAKNGRTSPPDESIGPDLVAKLSDPYFAIRPVYCPGLGIVNT